MQNYPVGKELAYELQHVYLLGQIVQLNLPITRLKVKRGI